MYKDVLRSIAGIEMFPVISLLVFVAVFVVMLVWVWRLDPRRLSELANLPLDDADRQPEAAPSHEAVSPARGGRS